MNGEFFMPTLSHFENDNGWSGSRGVMCYEIEKPKEGQVRAVTWYGPFCRSYAEEMAEAVFPVSQEGRQAMIDWLLARAEEMNAHPERTPEDCRAYYEKVRREEKEPMK